MEFNILNENSEFKLGNILTIFMLPNSNREIAVFTISAFDEDDDTLNIAYINKDKNGYDYLEEIEDDTVYREAMIVVQDIMKNIN